MSYTGDKLYSAGGFEFMYSRNFFGFPESCETCEPMSGLGLGPEKDLNAKYTWIPPRLGPCPYELVDGRREILTKYQSQSSGDGELTIGARKFKTRRFGNKIWMIENLKINLGIRDRNTIYDWGYDECYFTWQTAKAVAEFIPGWHLPTIEEWEQLVLDHGGKSNGESFIWLRKYTIRSFSYLSTRFNVKLSGRFTGSEFREVGSNATLWTSKGDGHTGCAYSIDKSDGKAILYLCNPKLEVSCPMRLVMDEE